MPRLKGIMKYANFATTLNKFTVTNYMKFEFLNSLLKMYGISESSSGLKETQLPKKKRENKDVLYIKKTRTDTVKSFDKNLNKDLLCKIKTERKANAEAKQYMLNVLT